MDWRPTAEQAVHALLALPFPVALLSPSLRYVGVTKAWAELYSPGETPEAWEDQDHLGRFPQLESLDSWRRPLEAARAGRTSDAMIEVVRLPGDQVAVLQWWAVAWPSAPGGAMVVAQDVTELASTVARALEASDAATGLADALEGASDA